MFACEYAIYIFYRYIQFGDALGMNNRETLAEHVKNYIYNEKVDGNGKENFKKLFKKEHDNYEKNFKENSAYKNPLEELFDNILSTKDFI